MGTKYEGGIVSPGKLLERLESRFAPLLALSAASRSLAERDYAECPPIGQLVSEGFHEFSEDLKRAREQVDPWTSNRGYRRGGRPLDQEAGSPDAVLEHLIARFSVFESIARTSLLIADAEEEMCPPLDRTAAEAVLVFGNDLRRGREAARLWLDSEPVDSVRPESAPGLRADRPASAETDAPSGLIGRYDSAGSEQRVRGAVQTKRNIRWEGEMSRPLRNATDTVYIRIERIERTGDPLEDYLDSEMELSAPVDEVEHALRLIRALIDQAREDGILSSTIASNDASTRVKESARPWPVPERDNGQWKGTGIPDRKLNGCGARNGAGRERSAMMSLWMHG